MKFPAISIPLCTILFIPTTAADSCAARSGPPHGSIIGSTNSAWKDVFKDEFHWINKSEWDVPKRQADWNISEKKFSTTHFYLGSMAKIVPRNKLKLSNGKWKENGSTKFFGSKFQSKKRYKYGYFEACIKMDWYDDSIWPTFWLITPHGTKVHELDIMEFNHNQVEFGGTGPGQNMWYDVGKGDPASEKSVNKATRNQHTKWTRYSVLWRPGRIVFFIDGEMKHFSKVPYQFTDSQPMNIRLTTTPDQSNMGSISQKNGFPSFQIDSVNVWQFGNEGWIE